jgi:HK97 family phage portal protein
MAIFQNFFGWFGRGGAIGEQKGEQHNTPGVALIEGASNLGPDGALQISAVWACIDLRASTIASLPFFAYETVNGEKKLARNSRLYSLLHESPNARHTPFEFWRSMMLNHDLRGNAFARLERDNNGEVTSMWPMPADQVTVKVLGDGSMVYEYQIGADVAVLAESSVLHLKNLGNGTMGLSKLDFMRSTTDESAKAQGAASKVFGTGGKPTGILMIDKVLNPAQRESMLDRFAGMAEGNTSRLYLLEAAMKYQQLSLSPEDQQLLDTRKYGVEEVCRWFGVPPVLIGHANVTTWGSGIEQILDGFYKLQLRPMLVSIEQATRKRVLTPAQRAKQSIEFSFDGLLRGSLKDRMAIYSQAVQNGIYTRSECRQFENMPAITDADELTAQSNLLPLKLLGSATASGGTGAIIAQ